MRGTLVSVQVGLPGAYGSPQAVDPMDRPWTSGIAKQPVDGPVAVGRTNLAGDGQADLRVHGGPDKAILAYAAGHYPAWRRELELDLPHGAFGENLTIQGLDEATVWVGDVYEIGSARVEVSQPRGPCWKLARRWRIRDLAARVERTGRTGWYLRVLREGVLEAGNACVPIERPHPGWTIERANRLLFGPGGTSDEVAALAALPPLAPAWRDGLLRRAARRAEGSAGG